MYLSYMIHIKILSMLVILFQFILVHWHKCGSRRESYIHYLINGIKDSLRDIFPKRCYIIYIRLRSWFLNKMIIPPRYKHSLEVKMNEKILVRIMDNKIKGGYRVTQARRARETLSKKNVRLPLTISTIKESNCFCQSGSSIKFMQTRYEGGESITTILLNILIKTMSGDHDLVSGTWLKLRCQITTDYVTDSVFVILSRISRYITAIFKARAKGILMKV